MARDELKQEVMGLNGLFNLDEFKWPSVWTNQFVQNIAAKCSLDIVLLDLNY